MFDKNKISKQTSKKISRKKSLLSTWAISLSLLCTGVLTAGQALAANCYIMVHGHGVQGNVRSGSNQPALEAWRTAEFSNYQGSDFFDELLDPTDNYGIVGYDSTDEGAYPYWRDETAGEIARQIISIKQGNGDGYNHDQAGTQCGANDNFWVISHSQGAPEMIWISGNAISGSPYYNTAFGVSSAVSVDYASAMNGVLGIFTLGGAITGTEGADRVCNGNWLDDIVNAAFLGRSCNASIQWLQTNDVYTVRNYIGSNLAAPIYVMGGYKGFPGFSGASSAFLEGEDDGYINLASQMSCSGSAKRNLYSDLNTYKTFFGIAYGSPTYRCNNSNKGTPRTYNMASIYTDHDAERNAGISSPSYTSIENGITCGAGRNMAGRIDSCL